MTTQQMIENAMLDALGLLSAEEQSEFERAFQAAAPAVQAHVRREQTRLSRIEALLPKVEPPVDLRAAVIQAVREAMVAQLAEREAEEVRGRGPIPILSSLHVSPVWRAASLGFAAAAAVFGATTLFMWGKYTDVNNQINANAFSETMMAQVGAEARAITLGHTAVAKLFPADPAYAGPGEAKLHYSEAGEATLAFSGLPNAPGGEYIVMLVDADGKQMELKRFTSSGSPGRVNITLAAEHHGMRLALAPAAGDRSPLLLSDALRLG